MYNYDIVKDADLFAAKIKNRRKHLFADGGQISFDTIRLDSWDCHGYNFEKIENASAIFAFAEFTNCNFTRCKFPCLENVNARNNKFVRVKFFKLYKCYMIDNSFDGALFEDGIIEHCQFENSIFHHANFGYARIFDCDFTNADFEYVEMRGVIVDVLLYAINIITFDFDPREYKFIGIKHGDEIVIKCGCRYFDEKDAIAHWSDPEYHTFALGQKYLAAIKSAKLFLGIGEMEK